MAYAVGSRGINSEEIERIARQNEMAFGIVTGGVVTLNANLVVDVSSVAANDYVIAGAVQANAYSASTVTLDAADATNPRIDIITIDTSGTVGKVSGTAAATPFPPAIGDTKLALAEIRLAANATAIDSAQILDKRIILKPKVIWVQPHAVSASGATLASIADTPYAASLLGTGSADGAAHFTVPIPVNFQGLRRAVINGLPNGTGNMHYEVTTNFAASGEAKGANTDSISTTLVAVTDNQMLNIDISAAFTGIAAGDFVGVLFNRDGDNASDTITDFMCHGLMLEYY